MPQVKALKPHDNKYGENYHKNTGDTYEHPAPQPLIDNNIVEIVNGKDGKGRGAAGAGADASKPPQGDGPEHNKSGADKAG